LPVKSLDTQTRPASNIFASEIPIFKRLFIIPHSEFLLKVSIPFPYMF
jgi:hypothetical protein